MKLAFSSVYGRDISHYSRINFDKLSIRPQVFVELHRLMEYSHEFAGGF